MALGLLEVRGLLYLDQLWPNGSLAADATSLWIQTGPDSFRFRPAPGLAPRVTHVFQGATVAGVEEHTAVHAEGIVGVRLQGVDGPELHYRPRALARNVEPSAAEQVTADRWRQHYRQRGAETATRALGAFLSTSGLRVAPCVVSTAVDRPAEAFDSRGRLVGELFVEMGGERVSLNRWLLETGWALPAFYSSMSPEEIVVLRDAARRAERGRRGLWRHLARDASRFEPLVFREPSPRLDHPRERGPILMPKLFRRLCTWAVNRKACATRASLLGFLEEHPDGCYETDAFLEHGLAAAPHRRLGDYLSPDGAFGVGPDELVFQEEHTTLRVPGGRAEWFPARGC